MLAHNLLWTLIHQAAARADVAAGRISFTGTIQTVLSFSPALRYATANTRPIIYTQMLTHIATQINRHRPNRTGLPTHYGSRKRIHRRRQRLPS